MKRAGVHAAEAQKRWARTSYEERARVMRRAGDLWETQAADVQQWLVREAGSIPPKAAVEAHGASNECYEASALASHEYGRLLPSAQPRLSLSRRLPAGVVGVISPFNFPLILSIRAVAPALALGNAVLHKPDPRTAVSGGVALARVLEEVDLPPACSICSPAVPTWGRPSSPTFTSGWSPSRARPRRAAPSALLAAQHLKRAHLELGGNSALVVLDDVDLDAAASAAPGRPSSIRARSA